MSAVREALCKFLQADEGEGKLMELAKDVYPGMPPEGADDESQGLGYPLVVVEPLRAPRPELTFGGVDHEESVYIVKAVTLSSSPATACEMAKRVRARLDPDGKGEVDLEVEGYGRVTVGWVGDVEYDDPQDDGTVYRIEGGQYEVYAESAE